MRTHKRLTVLAIVLVVLGILVCAISFTAMGFDFKALNTADYVTNEYEVGESFENISITGDTEEIVFAPAEDGKCRVVCYEDKKEPHNVRVESGTLTIDRKANRRWHLGFFFGTPRITVYLSDTAYGILSIDADTGDVTVPEDFSFESIDIKLSTGDVSLSASARGLAAVRTSTGRIGLRDMSAGDINLSQDTGHASVNNVTCDGKFETKISTGKTDLTGVSCGDLYSAGSTGSMTLRKVIASGEFHLKRSTGDIRFDGCDAEAVYVKTDTGDIEGTLLSDKVFRTDTDTGKVDVPVSAEGGICELTTDTGNISISIAR